MNGFEDFFEHAPCGLAIADQAGQIVRANQTLARWLGATADSLEGRPFSKLLTVGGRIFYETHIAPSLRMQGALDAIALDLAAGDGRKVPVLINACEKRSDDGTLCSIRFAIFDASDRRRYEENLLTSHAAARAEVEEARSLSELREQFIAVLGHDLRNPVASIAGGLRMLEREPVSERGRKVLGLMAGSVVRASTLIENVMDFARARLGGGIGIEPGEHADVAALIEQVVSEMRTIAPDRVIVADLRIEAPVSVDRGRLQQLISNLLGNALTHGAEDQPISLRADSDDGAFTLSVTNGGERIPAATIENLFQPFFRGSIRPSQQGLGLGLHITSEIAKAHGGSIDVASDDETTTFTFRMPLIAD